MADALFAVSKTANQPRTNCASTAFRLHSDCRTTAFSRIMESETEIMKIEVALQPNQNPSVTHGFSKYFCD